MPHYVYLLTIAEQPQAIYIGVTAHPADRLSQHKSSSRHGTTQKDIWIREALEKGQSLQITVVAEYADRENAHANEIRLIAEARATPGTIVLNTEDGGGPSFKSVHLPENREKARRSIQKANSQHWEVTDPWGEVLHVTNMKEFCKERNLDCSTMSKVANGQQESHKGYHCTRIGKTPRKAA